MSTIGYLSHLDRRLGLADGRLLELCQKSIKTGSVERRNYKITYRGMTTRSTRVGPKHFLTMSKWVFLIEGMRNPKNRNVLAQISLSVDESAQKERRRNSSS